MMQLLQCNCIYDCTYSYRNRNSHNHSYRDTKYTLGSMFCGKYENVGGERPFTFDRLDGPLLSHNITKKARIQPST